MHRLTRDRPLLLTLLVAALLVRFSGVHLHLCYDGQEPPASLHVADAGLHDDHDTGPVEHRDVDVQLESGFLKSWKLGVDLPAILDTRALAPIIRETAWRVVARTDPPSPRAWHDFARPPQRAPPR
jgi:hypothetical protein